MQTVKNGTTSATFPVLISLYINCIKKEKEKKENPPILKNNSNTKTRQHLAALSVTQPSEQPDWTMTSKNRS